MKDQNGVAASARNLKSDHVTSNGSGRSNGGPTTTPAAATKTRRRRQQQNNNNNNTNDLNHRSVVSVANDDDDDSAEFQVEDGQQQQLEATTVAGHGAAASEEELDRIPTRTEILLDRANMCTLAGAVLATLAMASMWKGRYYLGMCLNVAANVADIIDGPIARATVGRHRVFSVVGCKLDCYSDLVSHFVVPASLLMHLTDTNPLCAALAAAYVCAGIIRQSYFEVTGRCADGACIYGVTSDYMVAIYSLAMHLLPVVGHASMPFVLVPCVLLMIFCSLTFSLRSRRYDGFGLFTVTAYNVSLWASCLALAVVGGGGGGSADVDDGGFLAGVSASLFAVHLLLAYPCYFRFVELNI